MRAGSSQSSRTVAMQPSTNAKFIGIGMEGDCVEGSDSGCPREIGATNFASIEGIIMEIQVVTKQ
jgi:hypothetical protein